MIARTKGEYEIRPYNRQTMDKEKEKQEISLIGRIFSLEALLVVMGIISLVSGLVYRKGMQVFSGLAIIALTILLLFVRKRYFKKQ